jgi:hypothetical protein
MIPLPKPTVVATHTATVTFVEDMPPLVWRGDFEDAATGEAMTDDAPTAERSADRYGQKPENVSATDGETLEDLLATCFGNEWEIAFWGQQRDPRFWVEIQTASGPFEDCSNDSPLAALRTAMERVSLDESENRSKAMERAAGGNGGAS